MSELRFSNLNPDSRSIDRRAHLALIQNPILGDIRKYEVDSGILFDVVVAELDKATISRRILKYSEIHVNGIFVPWQEWKTTRVYAGDVISVSPMVRGGGDGKNPLATIMMLVVAAVAIGVTQGWASGLIPGFFGAGSTSAMILGSAIMIGGSLLIGMLFPNQTSLGAPPSYTDDKVFAIQNTQNSARPYESFPVVVGRIRVAPDFAAQPYTVLVGNAMYRRYLYLVSAGDVQVSGHRIGDTAIGNFKDAELIVHKAWRGEQLTWFDRRIQEIPENVTLTKARSYVTRTSPLDTKEATVLIVFPRGLVTIYQDGSRAEQMVEFQIQYRAAGASSWTSVQTARKVNAKTFSAVSGVHWFCIPPKGGDPYVVTKQPPERDSIAKLEGSYVDRIVGWVPSEIPTPIYERTWYVTLLEKNYTGNITFSTGVVSNNPPPIYFGAGTSTVPYSFSQTAKTTSQQRIGFNIKFPSAGQYDIRIRRMTADADLERTDYTVLNESVLMGMQYHATDKSIKYRGRAYTLVELQLKASEELSGNVDTYNCLVQSYGQTPNSQGTGVSRGLSQNPAALALELMTSADVNYRPIPLDRIDLATWRQFYNFCQNHGWQYNHVHQDGKPLGEVLLSLLSAGLGTITLNGAHQYSVAWDEPDADYVDMATPRTCWGFEIRKEFPIEPIDGLRVEFINEDKNYQVDERTVYTDGINDNNAKNVQRWNIPGVTKSDLVWKHGRLRLAAMRLRPETIVYNTDWRSIDYKRGQKIRISYDTYMVGSGQGMVVEHIINPNDGLCDGFMLDSFFDMLPNNRYIARDSSKRSVKTWRLVTDVGRQNIAMLETPMPVGQAPQIGRIISVGISGRDSMEVTIQSIEHMENFNARITAIPSAPAIMQAISGKIPPWNSLITSPSYYDRRKPNAPFLQGIRSDESVLVRLPGAGLVPRIAISYELVQKTGITVDQVVAQIREVDTGEDWRSAGSVSGVEREIFIEDVLQGHTYEIRLCAFSTLGGMSDWVELSHTVIGMATPPPDIVMVFPEGNHLVIQYDAPIDFAGYEVLMAYYHSANVRQAISFGNGLFTTSSIDISGNLQGERAFFIYAVDLAGNRSLNPAVVRMQYEGARDANVILSIDHRAAGFPGIKDGCHVDANGDLVTDEISYFWGDDSSTFYGLDDSLFWQESRYSQMTYIVGFAVPPDAQGVSAHFLKRQIGGQILSLDYNVGDHKVFWGADPGLFWDADDGALFWPTAWAPLPDYLPADFSFMTIRVVLAGGLSEGRISEYVSEFDVPDVEEILTGYVLTAGWNVVQLQKVYRNIKYADTIIYETEGLDPITVNKRISGGQIELMPVDSYNNPTQAVVNLVIRGY